MSITVRYSSVDGFRQTRRFKTLAGARAYASKWVGPTPDVGRYYAVSFDGIGKIEVSGDATIRDLFGDDDHKIPASGNWPTLYKDA